MHFKVLRLWVFVYFFSSKFSTVLYSCFIELDWKEKHLEMEHSCNKRLTQCTLNSWPIVWELFYLSDRLAVLYLPNSMKLLASSGAPFVTMSHKYRSTLLPFLNWEMFGYSSSIISRLRVFLSVWSSDGCVCLILWNVFLDISARFLLTFTRLTFILGR